MFTKEKRNSLPFPESYPCFCEHLRSHLVHKPHWIMHESFIHPTLETFVLLIRCFFFFFFYRKSKHFIHLHKKNSFLQAFSYETFGELKDTNVGIASFTLHTKPHPKYLKLTLPLWAKLRLLASSRFLIHVPETVYPNHSTFRNHIPKPWAISVKLQVTITDALRS